MKQSPHEPSGGAATEKTLEATHAMRRSTGSTGWHKARTALFLSSVFPGCGHVYAGRPGLGFLWSCVFLVLFLPGAILLYIDSSSRGSQLVLALALLALLLLCGADAARVVLRSSGSKGRKPSVWIIETCAALIALGAVLEVRWFVENCLESVTVGTSRLEPIVSQGDEVTVVRSKYVEPVYGDVLLFRVRGAGGVPTKASRLGRVLARPGDFITAKEGSLIVNGVPLDLTRNDLRRKLERAERRKRYSLSRIFSPRLDATAASQDGYLYWEDKAWGPYVLPEAMFLLRADTDAVGSASIAGGSRGTLVKRRDVLGRVLY